MKRPVWLARLLGSGLDASVLHGVFGLALIGARSGRGRSGTVVAVLLAATLMSGAARAGDDWEFWPEVNAYAKLDPQLRLHFVGAYARGKDSYNQTLDMAGYLDVSLEPRLRKTLRQEDWLKNKYLWARVGYAHVFKAEGGVPSPAEDRGVASLYSRAYPPGEIVFEGRGRAEFRWIDGDYSTRYRLRGELNREFSVLDHTVMPFGNIEWFYDDRYDGWSRILYQAGTEITFSSLFRAELYLARQQEELPRESTLDALGVVAKWYF